MPSALVVCWPRFRFTVSILFVLVIAFTRASPPHDVDRPRVVVFCGS